MSSSDNYFFKIPGLKTRHPEYEFRSVLRFISYRWNIFDMVSLYGSGSLVEKVEYSVCCCNGGRIA